MRTDFAELLPVPPKLTVEHVLPQKSGASWPTQDEAADLDRELHVNRLGNLTLVTAKLNPSMSNAAWPTKRAALNEHSVLLLNRRLADENEAWDEERIDKHSEVLAERVIRLWPGPSTGVAEWRGLVAAVAGPQAGRHIGCRFRQPQAHGRLASRLSTVDRHLLGAVPRIRELVEPVHNEAGAFGYVCEVLVDRDRYSRILRVPDEMSAARPAGTSTRRISDRATNKSSK